jgi:hypothetical protein
MRRPEAERALLQRADADLAAVRAMLVGSHEEAAQPERAGDGVRDALAVGRRPLLSVEANDLVRNLVAHL